MTHAIAHARVLAALAVLAMAAACGGQNKDQRDIKAGLDSLTATHDSSVRSLDSTGAARQVDTTKLGAAKTESILTKARKTP